MCLAKEWAPQSNVASGGRGKVPSRGRFAGFPGKKGLHNFRRRFPPGIFFVFPFRGLHLSPLLHRPQKNVISPMFCANVRLEASLPVYFSCTTFCRSATTSITLLIPKCTTRRWTLRCSNYSVAKRQLFSCALITATLSLKFENVVLEGLI